MLLQLMRRPQKTISVLLEEDPRPWLVPLAGYSCISFAEGYERVAIHGATWPVAAIIAVAAVLALAVGSWTWAGIFGGALHLSSRVLGGRRGASGTIRAVGYAFFWPGLLAIVAVLAMLLLGYRGGELSAVAGLPALAQVGAALWGVYMSIAALRVRHGFGWWRAAAAYLLPFSLVLIAAAAYLAMSGSLR